MSTTDEQDEQAAWRARFLTSPSAVLATISARTGSPHLVPIVFSAVEEIIVSAVDHKPKRTAHLARLDNIEAHPSVSLLADRYDDDWEKLWWVRADGTASVHHEGSLHDAALDALQRKYRHYHDNRPQGPVIAVRVETWRGWRAAVD